MELEQLLRPVRPGEEVTHVFEETVGGNEAVGHRDAAELHDVSLAVVDAGDAWVVVVRGCPYLLLCLRKFVVKP